MAKVAWLFPGQGTQEVGMGKAAFDASAAARAVFERSDRVLAATGGISKLCFEGPKEELTLTANTQPAIVTTSLAVLAALREAIPELPAPSFATGHSLGEYSALVAAGAFELEDAVRIVRLRGQAMQEAVPPGEGAMAAVMGLAADVVEAVCAEAATTGVVSPANFNAPGQIVIAGQTAAVKRASELAAARGGKAMPLPVSAPFHCSLMRPAAERVAPELAKVQIGPLAFPVIANVDGEPNVDAARVRDLLVRQIDGAVQWVKIVERMAAEGVTQALEIGPGRVLGNLAKRITKDLRVLSVSDPASAGEVRTFLGL
jgi:[acyl-carrier-protein] S-malonyltransferase